MAPYLKWLLMLVVALGVAAFLVSTIDQVTFADTREHTPERLRSLELGTEEMQVALELAQLMRRDSLLTLLPRSSAPLYRAHPDLKSVTAGLVSKAVASGLRALNEPRSRIGVFIIDESYGSYGSMFSNHNSVEFFAGTDVSGPYCMVTGLAHREGKDGPLHFSFHRDALRWTNWGESAGWLNHVLGPCAFWARYGLPGPMVKQWLDGGGYHFANAPAHWLLEASSAATLKDVLKFFDQSNTIARGCQAGRQNECLKLTLDPWSTMRWRESSPVANVMMSSYVSPVFGTGDAALLAHIEKEFGPERFQRFWESAAPVESAFENAFGVPMDRWVTQWVQKYFGMAAAGPGLDLTTVLLSLLAVATLVAVSVRLGHRRSVGEA